MENITRTLAASGVGSARVCPCVAPPGIPTHKRHGLGLARRLIEQVRGTVIVDSDRGTVWTIKFPTTTMVMARAA